MQERDNLNGEKPATGNLTSPGGNLAFQMPGVPYVIISYMPFDQRIQNDSFFFKSRYSTISMQSGYQYSVANDILFTGINIMDQKEYFSAELAPGNNRSIFLNQLFQMRKGFSVNGSIGWVHSVYQSDIINMLSYDIHMSGKLTKKLQLGGYYTRGSSFYQFIRKTWGAQGYYDLNKKNRIVFSVGYNRLSKNDVTTLAYLDMHIRYQMMW
jgi:hypothetical protein